MGGFDKDKEIGRELTTAFAEKEEFVLVGVKVDDAAVKTDYGMADKSTLTVRPVNGSETFEVTSLGGAIADKCKAITEDELPCVICWLRVESKQYGKEATVIQYIRDL